MELLEGIVTMGKKLSRGRWFVGEGIEEKKVKGEEKWLYRPLY